MLEVPTVLKKRIVAFLLRSPPRPPLPSPCATTDQQPLVVNSWTPRPPPRKRNGTGDTGRPETAVAM